MAKYSTSRFPFLATWDVSKGPPPFEYPWEAARQVARVGSRTVVRRFERLGSLLVCLTSFLRFRESSTKIPRTTMFVFVEPSRNRKSDVKHTKREQNRTNLQGTVREPILATWDGMLGTPWRTQRVAQTGIVPTPRPSPLCIWFAHRT